MLALLHDWGRVDCCVCSTALVVPRIALVHLKLKLSLLFYIEINVYRKDRVFERILYTFKMIIASLCLRLILLKQIFEVSFDWLSKIFKEHHEVINSAKFLQHRICFWTLFASSQLVLCQEIKLHQVSKNFIYIIVSSYQIVFYILPWFHFDDLFYLVF